MKRFSSIASSINNGQRLHPVDLNKEIELPFPNISYESDLCTELQERFTEIRELFRGMSLIKDIDNDTLDKSKTVPFLSTRLLECAQNVIKIADELLKSAEVSDDDLKSFGEQIKKVKHEFERINTEFSKRKYTGREEKSKHHCISLIRELIGKFEEIEKELKRNSTENISEDVKQDKQLKSSFLHWSSLMEFFAKKNTNSPFLNSFLMTYCIICLGLIAFLGIAKGAEKFETIIESTKKVACIISILAPIIYGIWILTYENYNGGITPVLGRNWGVIGSMFPMLLGLRENRIKEISKGKDNIESCAVMVAMSVIIICGQTFGKMNKKMHGRQIVVFVIGNILMGLAYITNHFMLSVENRNNFISLGYIMFALMLCFIVIIGKGGKMENQKNQGIEWLDLSQWVMSFIFVILGIQNIESYSFYYAQSTLKQSV
ncbi:DUF1686 domain-containing protein [Encephalitozoon hellem]|uniref:DUF1686 domain-containing protein n=1 Tax=Encephalitozoon hellem TaxID=27973 RepID=A0ABY8CP09_ENCHE|nr:DUF1686 domain-containing protein [Encephalitozoon hellem]